MAYKPDQPYTPTEADRKLVAELLVIADQLDTFGAFELACRVRGEAGIVEGFGAKRVGLYLPMERPETTTGKPEPDGADQ